MRSDTGYILKGEPAGPDVGCERNQGVKDDSRVLGLSNWGNGASTTQMAQTKRGGLAGRKRAVTRSQFGT